MVEYRLLHLAANPITGESIPVIGVFGLTTEDPDFDPLVYAGGLMVARVDGAAMHRDHPENVLCGFVPPQTCDVVFGIGDLADTEEFNIMLEHELGHCDLGHTGQVVGETTEAGGLVFQCQLENEVAADAHAAAKYGKTAVAAAIVDWTVMVAVWAGYSPLPREVVVQNLRKMPVIAGRLDALK